MLSREEWAPVSTREESSGRESVVCPSEVDMCLRREVCWVTVSSEMETYCPAVKLFKQHKAALGGPKT